MNRDQIKALADSLSVIKVQNRPPTHRVVLRRANGRYVREFPAWSKYAAKKVQDRLEDRYDDGYYTEVEPWPASVPLSEGYQYPRFLQEVAIRSGV